MVSPPLFQEELYDRIDSMAKATWQKLQDYAKDAIPDRSTLRNIFETAFFASLRSEEGAPISFRLTYSDPQRLEIRERRWPAISTIKFAKTFPLSVAELVKLAPSHDPRTATFAIIPSPEGPRIAGIFQFGPIRAPLVESGGNVPPMGFTVLAKGPGRLALSVGTHLIARFEDGEFRAPEPGALWTHTAIGATLHETALSHTWHEPNGVDKKNYATVYLRCFEELLYGMSARGHGGTVLWVPRAALPNAKTHLNLRREVSASSHSGVLHLSEFVTAPSGDIRHQMLSRLRQYIGMLAQFSVVDGALLIDDYLLPIGYSCEILAPAWTGAVLNMSDLNIEPVDLAKLGMRHNSAVRFAAAVPESVVLVVSADGPARGIISAKDKLLWWPDVTTSVFA
jgi:hypothetical protein